MTLPESLTRKTEEIIFRYPPEHREAALVPVMFEAQRALGCITPETEKWLMEVIGVSAVKVREVLTFYSMFRTQPAGKYLIQLCRNISCCLAGAEDLQAYLEKKLGISGGQTTADGMFTLTYVECLGGCAWAPMMLVNEDQYYHLTPARIDQILEGFRTGKPVEPDAPTPLKGNVGEARSA
jgi:NADH-quinone oxidoreductase subunit E